MNEKSFTKSEPIYLKILYIAGFLSLIANLTFSFLNYDLNNYMSIFGYSILIIYFGRMVFKTQKNKE